MKDTPTSTDIGQFSLFCFPGCQLHEGEGGGGVLVEGVYIVLWTLGGALIEVAVASDQYYWMDSTEQIRTLLPTLLGT